MLASIKSDLRKLLTIRSTYFITVAAMIILALLSFYAEGWKGATGSPASLANEHAVEVILIQSTLVVLLLAIICILHMAHEYRYNTIMYTLTANVSRTKVLLSKMVSVSIVALLFGAILISFSIVCYMLGLSLRDISLPTQDINIFTTIAKFAFYFVGYALIALFIAVIIRSLVGAIAFFFIVPTTIESLLQGFWLKDNAKYLPFQSLDGVISTQNNAPMPSVLSPADSAIVASIYIVILGLIAWLVMLKRDAN